MSKAGIDKKGDEMNDNSIKNLVNLVIYAGVLICGMMPGLSLSESHAQDAVLGEEAAKTIPIADAHFHVMPYMGVQDLLGYMDRNGIRWAGGAGVLPNGPSVAEVAAALGKRFIPYTGQGQWLTLKRTHGVAALENADSPEFKAALESMEQALRDSGARVIGEIHVNTLLSAANALVLHKVKADAPTLKAMFALAGKYKRPLNIHAQWDSDTAQEFARLAASNRDARLILSHCGNFATPADIRELFEKNPNVSCDLSFRSPPQLKSKGLARTIYDNRRLDNGWKKLIEDYPDRFVVGVDDVHNWPDYDATVQAIRFGLLANLRPDVAEKVAFKNAQAWFGLE